MTTILICSEDRIASDQIYNFNITIPNKTLPKNKRFQMRIMDLTIPFTFSQLNNQNNTINYSLLYNSVPYTSSITIPSGTYNIISLLSIIKTELNNSILIVVGLTLPFLFTYNRNNYHVTMGFDNLLVATTISWTNTKLNKMLGFNGIISFDNVSTLESTQPVNVNPIDSLYIRSNTLKIDGYRSNSGKSLSTDILLKIPLNNQPGSIIQYHSIFDVLNLDDTALNIINLNITDEDGTSIELLLDWSITLFIDTVDVKNPIIHEEKGNLLKPIEPIETKQQDFLTAEKQKTLDEVKALMNKHGSKLIPRK